MMSEDPDLAFKDLVAHEDFSSELRENQALHQLAMLPDNFHYLLDIITKKPSMDEITDHARCFKLPFTICDLF